MTIFSEKRSEERYSNIADMLPPEGFLWAFEGAVVSSPQRGLETMSFVSLQTFYEEKDQRKRWILSMMCVLTLVGIGLTASSTWAVHRLHVTVSFGVGLNTATPGNAANHKVIPQRITVQQGGVVHFLVSGFHEIFVYKIGTEPEDIVVPESGTFIDYDLTNLFYRENVRALQEPIFMLGGG